MIKADVQTAKANTAILDIILMALRFFLENKYLNAMSKDGFKMALDWLQMNYS
jgi:hypothetical protein